MKRNLLSLALLATLFPLCPAQANTPFKPERIGVEKEIKPGPNLYVMDQSWSGSSNITVLSAETLKTKGNLSTGLIAQMGFSKDRHQLYTASVYPKRILWGDTEAVVQRFNIPTLSLVNEIATSPKMAQVAANINNFKLSANDKYILVQNATPAASVSVLDAATGQALLEIPTPGCWAIYPSADDSRFSSLCGDGTVTSYQINADQKGYQATKSDKLFDADKDALFISAQRDGDHLIFTSFNGSIYLVNDKDAKATLSDKFSYAPAIKGNWRPGGFNVLALNQPNHLLFVSMHPNGKEGSHKDGAKEIWGIDMTSHKVVTRVKTHDAIAIAVSQTEKPELFALSEGEEGEGGTVLKYTLQGDKFVGKQTGKVTSLGSFNQILMVDY